MVPAIARASHLAQILKSSQSNPGYQQALQEVGLRVANQELTGSPNSRAALAILAQTAAIAHMAIRSANKGLAAVPDDANGFMVLGIAYACLDYIESAFRGGDLSSPWAKRRYY